MVGDKTRVLLILPAETLDRARVFAGKATTELRLPVSLQIVLRALIEEGLKKQTDAHLLANVERQAQTIRELRRQRTRRGQETHGNRTDGDRRPPHRSGWPPPTRGPRR
jgi:hypothetical protein